MSNYCKQCRYRVRDTHEKDACPFNYLYWHFLARHRQHFSSHYRMAMAYRTYDNMHADKKRAITQASQAFLKKLDNNASV